jgi:glycosyltransferase involved in cell wall biosynthesis
LPHKNIARLIDAFADIVTRYPGLLMVIAGRGDGCLSLQGQIDRRGLAGRVHLAGRLSEAELHACYRSALLFAFPSLMEGSGLPVLEAMASGCPVSGADIPPVVEVASGCAWLVNPLDVSAITNGLRRLIDDAQLRQDLSLRGRSRAAELSWQACAGRTLAVYRQVWG